MKRKLVIGAAALLAAGAAGATAAVASGDDGEGTVTGPQADRATAAALAETGGGTANAVERDSENGATWEVEVTTPDGKTVDVRLDENFQRGGRRRATARTPTGPGTTDLHSAGGSNLVVRARPAARPLPAMTSAILRDASSIISSPSMTAPRLPPASDVK